MLTLDDDEVDLLLPMIKWARSQAVDSKGAPSCFSGAVPLCAWALARFDEMIARIEQHQKDEAEEKADAGA